MEGLGLWTEKTDRLPHGTYRLTSGKDIKHSLQKTITSITKDVMKYRVLRAYKRGH